MNFSFGSPGLPKTATGFTLPTASNPAVSSAAVGGAGDNKTPTKPVTGLFSTPPPAGTTGFSLGSTPTAKTSTPTLNFGLPAAGGTKLTFAATSSAPSSTPHFNLGSSTAATTAPSSFTPILGASTSLIGTPVTPSLSASSTALTTNLPASTATSTLSFSLGGLSSTTTQVTTTASTSAVTSAAPTGGLTYAQLEDSINRWTVDLEEQGKFFINQAKQLNAWDSLLISNSEKILLLNDTIERVKRQQKELDQELDFILAQQNELDELSTPLEKQLSEVPIADQNRFQTYQLSEIIDNQLKQMSEDLKEIVEHLNESNKSEDATDPIVQVSRILNAHMNSLQWIDTNAAQIGSHLEQISKFHEINKKNHMNL